MKRRLCNRACLTQRLRVVAVAAVFTMFCSHYGAAQSSHGELASGEPLRVGTSDGVGRFAPPSISCSPLGAAHVFDGRRPDLFVCSDRWHPALYVYRWIEDDAHGVPVFSQPIEIPSPFAAAKSSPGYVLEDGGGKIHGFWLRGNKLVVAEFDRSTHSFRVTGRTRLEGLPRNPERAAVRLRPDNQLEGFVSVSDGQEHKPGDHRAKDYVPYDGAGIWRGTLPRTGIYQFRCSWPTLPKSASTRILLPPEKGALLSMSGLDWIEPQSAPDGQLLYGTKLGGMYFVPGAFESTRGADSVKSIPLIDPAGIAIRHPAVGTNLVAYTDAGGERRDLVAAGEGGMYYYRNTGRFGTSGQPEFETPRTVLQQSADLFAGSLIVVNVVDWNGDDRLDIVGGNAAGQLVFFENQGTNQRPRFLPATRIEAGGEPVLVRGGYRGSIQGPGEAHWGYASPCVVDWNQDGLPDIVMNDIRGIHSVYLNRGTRTDPKLALPRELCVDSLEFHGTWRTRPAAGLLGDRMAYVTLDDDDQVYLYWRIDDFNLEDGGKLHLTDGATIQANFLPVGGTGRAKFHLVDWDRDGKTDLLVGTPRHGSFPEPKRGVPWSINQAGAAVLLLRNVGSNQEPKYEYPAVLHVDGKPVHFGQHECSAVATPLGGGGPNILVGTELGRMIFIRGEDIEWKAIP